MKATQYTRKSKTKANRRVANARPKSRRTKKVRF